MLVRKSGVWSLKKKHLAFDSRLQTPDSRLILASVLCSVIAQEQGIHRMPSAQGLCDSCRRLSHGIGTRCRSGRVWAIPCNLKRLTRCQAPATYVIHLGL